MSQLILEFPLDREAADIKGDNVSIDLGNSVCLTTGIPRWVTAINNVTLQIILDIDGVPPDRN